MKAALVFAGFLGVIGFVYKSYSQQSEQEPVQVSDDSVQSFLEIESDHDMGDYTTNLVNMDCPRAQDSRQGFQKFLPNLQFISRGYNIYRSDPLAQHDRGFSGDVFAFDWDRTASVYYRDLQFEYPAELTVEYAPMCSAETTTSTMKDERDFQSKSATEVKASGSGGNAFVKASFKASAGFKQAKHEFESNVKGTCRATAECQMYSADTGAIPPCPS